MRPEYLVYGVTVLTSAVSAATIPVPPTPHNKNLSPTLLLPEQLAEEPPSWSERLRGFSAKLLGRPGKHGSRTHEQRHSPSSSQMSRYDGDIVLRFNLTTQAEGSALVDASQILFLDVWSSTKEHVDIRLPERDVPSLLGLLPDSLQHAHTRLMPDLGRAVQETFPGAKRLFSDPLFEESSKDRIDESNLFFHDYQPLSVMIPWMKLLESLFPSYVQTFSLGLSHEGREIMGLRVGNKKAEGEHRKAVIVTGAAHAREWISVSTVSYLAYSFITGHNKDKHITPLVDAFDWIFIPTLNVDGYAYTWEHDRLWRKNRQPTSLSFCKGIDLDRAYDIHWEAQKAQSNPCSDSFPGDAPFEAVESKRLSEWLAKEKKEGYEFLGYLDFHSYSQQILYPYSYSCSITPPDLENLEELAMGLAKVIRIHSGEHYEVASACGGSGFFTQTQTGGGGSALDYLYTHHVPFAYQIKLRDTGSYGFLLPRENIIPTGEESLGLIKYFGDFLLEDVARLGDNEQTKAETEEEPEMDQIETELKK